MLSLAPAKGGVVFGNLASDGLGALSSFNEDIRSNNLVAQGFSTGTSSLLVLDSIKLGLFGISAPSTIPKSIGLYNDSGGSPGSLLYSSTNSAVGDVGTYDFGFPSPSLSAGQTYWVVPDYDLSWYLNQGLSAPTAQNSSGYTYVGTLRSTNMMVSWSTALVPSYSISIQASEAIPEPGTWAAAVLMVLAAVLVAWRRRTAA